MTANNLTDLVNTLTAELRATEAFLVGCLSDHLICERGTEVEAQFKRRLASVREALKANGPA